MKQETPELRLLIFNCIIHIKSNSQNLLDILNKVYGAMRIEHNTDSAALTYTLGYSNTESEEFFISRDNTEKMLASDIGEFIFIFEKDMTIELQKIRSDLYFMHAAAIEYQGKAIIIVAPSGTGKSTTSWALLHTGFNYLSDELAPIDLCDMQVLPYPHALCLKDIPPVYSLPDDTLSTERTLHVPASSLPANFISHASPLTAIFFLQRKSEAKTSVIKTINKATSSTKIYANTLNALAHPEKGLDAAISIVSRTHCFDLIASDSLEDTCKNIIHTLDAL